jgi:hypothetical protein
MDPLSKAERCLWQAEECIAMAKVATSNTRAQEWERAAWGCPALEPMRRSRISK